jgi:hypothetical protein
MRAVAAVSVDQQWGAMLTLPCIIELVGTRGEPAVRRQWITMCDTTAAIDSDTGITTDYSLSPARHHQIAPVASTSIYSAVYTSQLCNEAAIV